ncbi:MAG: hypothetical protein F4X11_21255 [Acidobacteria bacterium]|nr:hypothetical protein [Acidobacteriota bacterium]
MTTAFIGGQLANQGVVPATSAVAMARGGGFQSSVIDDFRTATLEQGLPNTRRNPVFGNGQTCFASRNRAATSENADVMIV